MAWPNGTRHKTATVAGSWTTADMNGFQDQVLQVAAHRGTVSIPAEQARTNTVFGLLTTPDQVSGIVLPTEGLIVVGYTALWKNSVMGAGRAAIFLNANQLKTVDGNGGAPIVDDATGNFSAADVYGGLNTHCNGLAGTSSFTNFGAPVTTGQLIGGSSAGTGGLAYIFAAAGTYDVSVQFRATSGSVTVKDRRLWVAARGFV